MKRSYAAVLVFVACSCWTVVCWACPSCPIGVTAREQVFGAGFARNLLIALAPFILVGAVCAWAEGIGQRGDHASSKGNGS